MRLTNLKRSWFLFTLASDVSLAWAIIKFINLLPNFIISAERKKEIIAIFSCFLARLLFFLNPQIRVNSADNWDVIKDNQPFVMLINHTSQLDAFLYAARLPLKHAAKFRILFKGELLQVPILGGVLENGGHFPVHFIHSEVGKFSVDKEKQAKVLEDIRQHLKNGGNLALCPEGQINRKDPLKLQTFRQGSFRLLSELDPSDQAPASPSTSKGINMYAFLQTGLEDSWPPAANMGGDSANVHCKVFPLLFHKGSQANEVQGDMQKSLDSFSAIAERGVKDSGKILGLESMNLPKNMAKL